MAITVLNIMEQVGSRQTGRVMQYINDGLSEIADLIPDKVARSTISVQNGVRLYSLPSTMKKLLNVYQLVDLDNSIYQEISRIENLTLIQE